MHVPPPVGRVLSPHALPRPVRARTLVSLAQASRASRAAANPEYAGRHRHIPPGESSDGFPKTPVAGLRRALLREHARAGRSDWKLASAAQPGSVLIGFVDETVDKINQRLQRRPQGRAAVHRQRAGDHQQLARGRLEMGSVSYTGASVLIPEAALLNMPYLWTSDAERDFVTDNHALPVLKKIYEAKGLVIIGLGEVGWNDVVCKKACLTPADVKGMKVRVSPAPSSKMFWSSLQRQRRADAAVRAVPGAAERPGRWRRPALPVLHHHAGRAERAALRDDPAPAPRLHLHGQQGACGTSLRPSSAKLVVESRPDVGAHAQGSGRHREARRWPSSRPRAASCTS